MNTLSFSNDKDFLRGLVHETRIVCFPTPLQMGTIPHALQIKGNWIIVTLYNEWLWLLMQFDLRRHVNITKHVSF